MRLANVFGCLECLNHKSLKQDLSLSDMYLFENTKIYTETWVWRYSFLLEKRAVYFSRQSFLLFNFKAIFKAYNCIKNSKIFFPFLIVCRPTFALYKKHFYTLMKFFKLLVQIFNLLLLLLKPLQVKVNPFRINIQTHVHALQKFTFMWWEQGHEMDLKLNTRAFMVTYIVAQQKHPKNVDRFLNLAIQFIKCCWPPSPRLGLWARISWPPIN